jgi:two-component system chemotaxis sensor kinase CheA
MDESIINEFLVESHESLSQVERDLVALEREPFDPKRLAGVFRAIHTIKGTCGFFGFAKLESVAHAGENLLSQLRNAEVTLSAEMTGALLALVDAVREILTSIEQGRSEGDKDYSALIETLTRLQQRRPPVPAQPPSDREATPQASPGSGEAAPPAAPGPMEAAPPMTPAAGGPATEKKPAAPGTIGGGLLDSLVESGRLDPDAVMLAAQQQRLGDPRRIGEILVDHGALKPQDILEALIARGQAPASAITEANIRVDVHLLDLLMNLVGELVLARNQMLQFVTSQDLASLPAATQRLSLITTELQEGIMKTRMQPIGNLCNKLPRLVRDVAAACGREVQLEMEGIDTELDRTVIEAIRDPLTHLVRNAIDHGIESPEERVARGKPAEGRLLLRAYHEGGKVIVEVSDDGGGLSVERIREKGLRAGLVPSERVPQMTDHDWINLIFTPGFSTADKVTSVSGRGVGMDVVRTNVERIGGTIEVNSSLGVGTTMRICIPLTLAIIPALIVAAGGERYAIPQVSLLELVRTHGDAGESAVSQVYDAQVYRYRDRLLPLVFLHDALQIGGAVQASLTDSGQAALNIAVLHADGKSFGLVVDEILSSQEIVVKALTESLKQTPVFSGATILGDGRVALILDVPGLARHCGVGSPGSGKSAAPSQGSVEAPAGPTQTLVLFRLRDDWRVAIPLSGVARLEELPRASVERVGGRRVVQYRGGLLPLVRLLDLLEPKRDEAAGAARVPEPPSAAGAFRPAPALQVVVHERNGAQVGLEVEEILEIIEEDFELDGAGDRPGIVGSTVIRGKATDLIDLPALLASAEVAGFGTRSTAAGA